MPMAVSNRNFKVRPGLLGSRERGCNPGSVGTGSLDSAPLGSETSPGVSGYSLTAHCAPGSSLRHFLPSASTHRPRLNTLAIRHRPLLACHWLTVTARSSTSLTPIGVHSLPRVV